MRERVKGWPVADIRATSVNFKKAPKAKGKAHKNAVLSFDETDPE
jgi:hypothetical protein